MVPARRDVYGHRRHTPPVPCLSNRQTVGKGREPGSGRWGVGGWRWVVGKCHGAECKCGLTSGAENMFSLTRGTLIFHKVKRTCPRGLQKGYLKRDPEKQPSQVASLDRVCSGCFRPHFLLAPYPSPHPLLYLSIPPLHSPYLPHLFFSSPLYHSFSSLLSGAGERRCLQVIRSPG